MFNQKSNDAGFSVIIPIEGRSGLLKCLLESLRSAVIPNNTGIEILVVDSSNPREAGRIQTLCRQYEAQYLRGSRSVRQKRNQGAKEAQYQFLLFLDSDCQVSADLFVAYFHFLRERISHPDLLAAGPTHFRGTETFFVQLMKESSLLTPFRLPETEGHLLWTTTSNFLVSKKAFELAGGFREGFPWRLGGDDTELGLRLHDIGCTIKTVPGAVCFHSWQTWASPLSIMRRSFRWGWMQALILREHKKFRRWAAPGLPVYFLCCLIFSLIAAANGLTAALFAPLCFLFFAVVIHALLSAVSKGPFVSTFISDLILALVECPFGFGKVAGSLSKGTSAGIFFRIGINDAEMDRQFTEIVKDLWSNNISILLTIILIVSMVLI